MEKFGIFELLDALSALTSATTADAPALEPVAQEDAAETKKPAKLPDAAFAPPTYGNGQPAPPLSPQTDALDAFYARHEQARNKVKK